jgi:hypothetical protein
MLSREVRLNPFNVNPTLPSINFFHVDGLSAWALALGSGNSIFGPLGDEAPLKMRNRAEYLKDELAGSRRCVDFFFQAQERDPALFQRGNGREQFGQRTPEPVEANHGEPVASPCISEESGKARPIHRFAGTNVSEPLDGADCSRRMVWPATS